MAERVDIKKGARVMFGSQIGGVWHFVGELAPKDVAPEGGCKTEVLTRMDDPHHPCLFLEVGIPIAGQKRHRMVNSMRVFESVVALSPEGTKSIEALRAFCNPDNFPLQLAILVKGDFLARTISNSYAWLRNPLSISHPIAPYRQANGQVRVDYGGFKPLAEVSNFNIRPPLRTFWDMEEYILHMSYQATREQEYIDGLRDMIQGLPATMIWEAVPDRAGQYVAHFSTELPELISKILPTGEVFTAEATKDDLRSVQWQCTSGPPLRTADAYELSASVRATGAEAEYLQRLQARNISSQEVKLTVQEKDRAYRLRIEAIHRFVKFWNRPSNEPRDIDRKQIVAVKTLGEFLLGREQRSGQGHGLFSISREAIDKVKKIIRPMNQGQLDAFHAFRLAKKPLFFIQGAPGTGKTYVVEKIVASAVEIGKTVLLVAPTNAAGDLGAARAHAAAPEENVYCLWSLSDEILDFSKGGNTHHHLLEPQETSSLGAYLDFLRAKMRKNQLPEAIELSVHVGVLKMLDDPTQELTKEYLGSHQEVDFRLDKWFQRAVRHLLSKARAVITTISNSAAMELVATFKPDIGIVDEAGNAVEPEVLAAMSNFSGSVQVWIQVGDPAQLPPFVASLDEKTGAGLLVNPFGHQMRTSLMERMMLRGCSIETLTEQRRSVVGLMAPASKFFYKGQLQDGPGTELATRPSAQAAMLFLRDYFPAIRCPLVFWRVEKGRCVRDERTKSRFNMEDARAVVGLVRAYTRRPGVTPGSITVITPYRQQNTMIRQLLAEPAAQVGDPSLKDVLVDTIDSAQGHENDTVTFNPVVTVRARRGNEAVEHLGDRHRLCVAVTRAKNCMMVVGDFGLCDEMARIDIPTENLKDKPLHKYYCHFREARAVCAIPSSWA